ncbi:MAG: hypothetical protein WC477_00450 [Patescibacteria group bacterium]
MLPQQSWDAQQSFFDAIEKDGMQSYAKTISNLADAFVLRDRILRCMDEGTPGGIHAAGSGILMSKEDAVAFAKRANIEGITAHSGCGACGLYAKDARIHEDDPDACGPEWAQSFSESIHVPYAGNITANQMARPPEYHIARIAYYDGTGSFDFSRAPTLPPGFVISRAYLDSSYALKEMNVAVAIALGHHGFGELFTKEHPFRLVAIAQTADELASLQAELESVVALSDGRVVVDGFVSK